MTLVEARLDQPEVVTVLENGVGSAEVSKRLGVSIQRVHQLRHELGGVAVPRRKTKKWLFPADVGLEPQSTPAS